jgi:hypothetical protein
MAASERVDMDSPDYERGVDAANRALDRTHLSARDMLSQWELVAEAAHQSEHTERYHYAKGVVDTLREYLEDRAN